MFSGEQGGKKGGGMICSGNWIGFFGSEGLRDDGVEGIEGERVGWVLGLAKVLNGQGAERWRGDFRCTGGGLLGVGSFVGLTRCGEPDGKELL